MRTEHEERESLQKLVDELIEEHGTPSEEESAWARRALLGPHGPTGTPGEDGAGPREAAPSGKRSA